MMESAAESAPGHRPKRPVRRNPDARREQNRIASRNYREKRKQKLALLDQLVDKPQETSPSTTNTNTNPPASSPRARPDSSTAAQNHEESDTLSDLRIIRHAAQQAATAISTRVLNDKLTNHGWGYDRSSAWRDDLIYPPPSQPARGPETLPFTQVPTETSHSGVWEIPDSAVDIDPSLQDLTPAPTLTSTSTSNSTSTLPSDSAPEDPTVLSILSSIQSLSSAQKNSLLTHLKSQTSSPSSSTSSTSPLPPSCYAPTPTTLPGTNWVSHSLPPGPARTRLQDEARRFAHFIDRHLSGSLSPAQLSRIYVVEVGFYGALFANCYALGINGIEPLMEEDGVSPFSLGPDTGYHPSQLPVVRSKFSSITHDLQPTDVQLTFGHHPYLDVLPFRTFRENALRALEQENLDEDQLCSDLIAGGLVCWGSQQNSLGMEAGVPWDLRSWEPQVWFLQKYWHLVGGWDNEMWQCAKWWHQARGQKLQFG